MTSEEKAAGRPRFDPFAPFIQFTDLWLKSWSEVLSQTVASKGFAEVMAQQLEMMLDAGRLMRQQTRLVADQALEGMNLPSREQVTTLAERLTAVELRVDDIEAKVDESLDRLKAIQALLAERE